ncbi:hypothetical protein NG720_27725, partial [Klebsiella pneumoniae]|nr:hypothetical protein [Klebsiella pneumoniae]
MVFFAGHRQRLFPRYGDFDGSVNDSITPSFIDCIFGNDSNLLIVFYVQIVPDDFVMQLHR